MPKTVGILGGMGPEAGCEFYRKLIRLTPAQRDQEHLPVILYNQPAIPDRSDAIFNRGPSPVPQLQQAVRCLQQWGADLIAIPCNTAHYFYAEIQSAVTIPVLHIVEETVAAVVREMTVQPASIGLLATQGTLRTGLFQRVLERQGLGCVLPSDGLGEQVQQAIHAIKAGRIRQSAHTVQQAMEQLVGEGAQAVVFGCTELGLTSEHLQPPCRIFDSVDSLAQATVRMALGEEDPPVCDPPQRLVAADL